MAAKLFARGVSQAEVARRLNVSHQSGSRWHRRLREQGAEALVDAGWAGRPARPTGEQKTRVEAELRAHAGMPPRGWPR
ncbi:hypothetical protein BMW24_021525 [Mycobacterium heckeshornense]|uniref:helix-turn-helix domain-containing protein n=1 Tax=Mycobacterium heckeshornense TaxID=110505 RepID=UPI0008FD172F|nr:hypothetical protein BMW24_021525 [Mycobacterium heckeshornense]